MPLLVLVGGDNILFPASVPIRELSVDQLWGNYVRYIGAGAVAAGGIFSLLKSFPLIASTFAKALKGFGHTDGNSRTSKDIPLPYAIGGILIVAFGLSAFPDIPINPVTSILIIIFGFFFATVSARMVGVVGSSNNPVSGMAIATLLFATILLKQAGITGYRGMTSAICIGTVICIIAAMAGDTSQDLKTGYIVGATLMKMVVEGVMNGNLPWGLVIVGICIAVVVEILGIPVLPFAIGLYLPIYLTVPIMIGGLIRLFVEKRRFADEGSRETVRNNGILFSSGMIAGEGLVGILLAILAVFGVSDRINLGLMGFHLGKWGGCLFFLALLFSMIYMIHKTKDKQSSNNTL